MTESRDTDEKEWAPRGVDITKIPDVPQSMRGRLFTIHTDIVTHEKMHKVAKFRHFEIHCDEQEFLGGDDRHPNPLTYLAAGIGF